MLSIENDCVWVWRLPHGFICYHKTGSTDCHGLMMTSLFFLLVVSIVVVVLCYCQSLVCKIKNDTFFVPNSNVILKRIFLSSFQQSSKSKTSYVLCLTWPYLQQGTQFRWLENMCMSCFFSLVSCDDEYDLGIAFKQKEAGSWN